MSATSTPSPKRYVPASAPAPVQLYTTSETAKMLRVRDQTLRRWRWEGKGPRFLPGRRVFYEAADVAAFVESQKRQSTSEAA